MLTFAEACQGKVCLSLEHRVQVDAYATEFDCLKAAQDMKAPPKYLREHVTYECGQRNK